MKKIKFCPLCGGSAYYSSTIGIECQDCYLLMPVDDCIYGKTEQKKYDDTVDAWNKRIEEK